MANKEAAAKRERKGTGKRSTFACQVQAQRTLKVGRLLRQAARLSPDRCFVSPDFDLVSTKPGGRPARAPGGPQTTERTCREAGAPDPELVLRETRHRRLTVKQTCSPSARTVGKITFVNRFWDHWVCDGCVHKPAPCESQSSIWSQVA
jgi:hypothetical protein